MANKLINTAIITTSLAFGTAAGYGFYKAVMHGTAASYMEKALKAKFLEEKKDDIAESYKIHRQDFLNCVFENLSAENSASKKGSYSSMDIEIKGDGKIVVKDPPSELEEKLGALAFSDVYKKTTDTAFGEVTHISVSLNDRDTIMKDIGDSMYASRELVKKANLANVEQTAEPSVLLETPPPTPAIVKPFDINNGDKTLATVSGTLTGLLTAVASMMLMQFARKDGMK